MDFIDVPVFLRDLENQTSDSRIRTERFEEEAGIIPEWSVSGEYRSEQPLDLRCTEECKNPASALEIDNYTVEDYETCQQLLRDISSTETKQFGTSLLDSDKKELTSDSSEESDTTSDITDEQSFEEEITDKSPNKLSLDLCRLKSNIEEWSRGNGIGCTKAVFVEAVSIRHEENEGFEVYLDDLFKHCIDVETKYHPVNFLANQLQIHAGIRAVLVSWLTNIRHQLRVCQGTLFLTVNIVDRFLSVMQVSYDCLYLVGLTALLIAAKHEEVAPPEIQELLDICGGNKREQIKQLERIILVAVNFNLLVPTSQYFLEYYASRCIEKATQIHLDKLKEARALARCILELSLQDYSLCQFRPSMVGFCVWKISIMELDTSDGGYLPEEGCFNCNEFETCFSKLQNFMNHLLQTFSDISSVFEH